MNLNLIAILVSLAMMLTGAGGEGVTGETARNLVVSNVVVSYNGETLHLGPQARLGVSTDGERAVYDFSMDLNGETLLPFQLSAGEDGLTALSGESGVAVSVTADALEALGEQLGQDMELASDDAENPELMQFITDELLPAYAGVLQAAMDSEQSQEINEAAQAVFDKKVQRGEGAPGTVEIDGEAYEVTVYSYSLDGNQLAELSDAMYGAAPVLDAYYKAVFKLYGMLPEESGLTDVGSFADLFEMTGLQMSLDIDEQMSEDGRIDIIDGTLTMDMSAMVAAMTPPEVVVDGLTEEDFTEEAEEAEESVEAEEAAEAEDAEPPVDGDIEPEGDAPDELPAIEPIVMELHSQKIDEYTESDVSCVYDFDGTTGIDLAAQATQGGGVQDVEATVILTEDGRKTQGTRLSMFIAQDEAGGNGYSMTLKTIVQDTARVDVSLYGSRTADGLSENNVSLDVRQRDTTFGLSFDLAVTADAIEDVAAGHDVACVIDDLSEEGLEALAGNAQLTAALMKVSGSVIGDVAKLAEDPGVKGLVALMNGESLPIDVDDLDADDYEYAFDLYGEPGDAVDEYDYVVGDEDGADLGYDMDFGYDDEPVEDDGILEFQEPQLTWLPSGWTVSATNVDTTYDLVEMTITDEAGAECVYAIFFANDEYGSDNYIVDENGKVVEGRMMNVTDFGEGGLSVTVTEGGMYGNMMFTSEVIDMATIGKIVAGIQF